MSTQLERLKAYRESQNPGLAVLSHIQSFKGERGDVGPMGPAGRDGVDGKSIIGPAGRDGVDGKSIVGPRGPAGADGKSIVGPAGKDGKNATPLDPQSIIDAVVKEITSGKRIKAEHVDGLVGSLSELKNFLKVGGYRGGGDTVTAGTNVTISVDSNGHKVLNATGGGGGSGGFSVITISGTINDSNVSFTSATAPTLISINGVLYQSTGGAITWTYSGGNITLSSPVGTGGTIYGISGSSGSVIFMDNEVVAGSGTSWTLANTVILGTEQIYANGQRLTPTVDYSITGQSITTVNSFVAGTLLADYQVSGSSAVNFKFNEVVSGSANTFTLAHTPTTNTQLIFAIGQRLTPTVDYTIAGAVVTTVGSWSAGQIVSDYQY